MEIKKIILTGATGMIGRQTIPFLVNKGYDIYALSRDKNMFHQQGINWLYCDILNPKNVAQVFKEVKPQYLLHFAWDMKQDYILSLKNEDYKNASLTILKYFKHYGGKRAVFAGSYLEYDIKNKALKETDKTAGLTPFSRAKIELCTMARDYAKKHNISFGWGRLFSTFGEGGSQDKFIKQIVIAFRNGRKVQLDNGNLWRDFIYSKDAANAFVALLESDYKGIVNICTGMAYPLSIYAKLIARKLNMAKFLRIKHFPLTEDIPSLILGNNEKLKNKIGFTPKYNIQTALDDFLKDYYLYNN